MKKKEELEIKEENKAIKIEPLNHDFILAEVNILKDKINEIIEFING